MTKTIRPEVRAQMFQIANAMRHARRMEHLSVVELGEKAELGYKTVERFERQSRDISISTLISCMDVLGVNVADAIDAAVMEAMLNYERKQQD